MRILVSGGAGFLGSHVCDLLLQEGHEVIVVDNFVTGRRENLVHLEGEERFILQEGDLCLAPLPEVDAIFHLASPASPVGYGRYPVETMLVNSQGTHRLLELAHARGALFLLASTSEVYGDPEIHPQTEEYHGNVNPVGPRSVYDEAKRFAEALTMAYRRTHGVDTKIARIFNTYGPRMRLDDGRVVPNFIFQALRGEAITVYGDGSRTRSFCHVSDLVDGLLRLLESDHAGPINLGNDGEMTVLELARLIIRLTASGSELCFLPSPVDDPKIRRPDLTKARELLGYAPRVPAEEGLARTIAWFKARLAGAGA